jgi:MFS family permease
VGILSSPTLRPLKLRDFRLIWAGALVSNIGTWMETTALGTIIAKETRSATQVGFAAIAGFLPIAFASPIGGVLADRFDRRRFLQVTLLIETLFAALLAIVVALGERRTLPLAAIVFAASTVGAGSLPNRQAVLPSLVPTEDLPAAISLGSASWNGGRVFGPIAALLVTAIGPAWAFAANALSFLVLFAAWLTVTLPPVQKRTGTAGLVTLLKEGVVMVKRAPQLRFVVVFIAILAATAGPFIGLLPIAARTRFNIGAALFVSAQGLGAVLGALATTRLTRMYGRRGTMLRYLVVLPLSLLAYAYASNRYLAALAILVTGASYIGAFTSAQSILQLNSPPNLRARALAVFSVALGASYCLAMLANGIIADAQTIKFATVMQALLTVIGLGLLSLLFPKWWTDEPATVEATADATVKLG